MADQPHDDESQDNVGTGAENSTETAPIPAACLLPLSLWYPLFFVSFFDGWLVAGQLLRLI